MVLARLLRWVVWTFALLTFGAVIAAAGSPWGLFLYLWVLGAVACAAFGLSLRRRTTAS